MNTLTLEGWCKAEDSLTACPVEQIHFHIDELSRRLLEQAEEDLHHSQDTECFVPADLSTLELEVSDDLGELTDCQFRVYLRPFDQRGQFHLVGQRVLDHSLVYTNAVMVDQLG